MLSQFDVAVVMMDMWQKPVRRPDKLYQRDAVLVVLVPVPVDEVLYAQPAQFVTGAFQRVVVALLLQQVRRNGDKETGRFTA